MVENFIFPSEDGTVKISEGDQDLKTSTLIRDCPERGEQQDHLRGESDGSSSTPHLDDSTLDDAKAENDFWSISGDTTYRHDVDPRVKQYMPKEESFPIPLKYIDVTRTTDTTLGVMSERIILKIIGTLMEIESCRMHGQVSPDSLYWIKNRWMDIHGPERD